MRTEGLHVHRTTYSELDVDTARTVLSCESDLTSNSLLGCPPVSSESLLQAMPLDLSTWPRFCSAGL